MDTNRLRYFITVAEAGSLTKAAEMLGISHSGLSKAITSLEIETGFKIFRPQGRGLEITDDGKWFYKKALEILNIENEVFIRNKTKETTLVKIGLPEILAISCAGAIAFELRTSLEIISADFGEVEDKIINGEIDFGISFSVSPRNELEHLELAEIKFNSFARNDLIEKFFPEEIPFVVPTKALPFNPIGYKIRDGWPIEIPRKQRFSVSSFSIALDLVRSGQASVYMPNFIALLENEKITNEFKILKNIKHKKAETKRKIFLIKSKSIEESKVMKKASKIVRNICSES